ncbi:MAG: PAS domain S-box protein [Chloroflexi bacterium]|nr:PAS domain S-box protein [Chloroflexota bacterium]
MVRKTPRKQPAVIKQPEDPAHELADSIINTVREPLIALDQDLRVVKVNRSFYETFKVKPEDTVGQLIYDLGNKQWDIPRLRELLENILPQKTIFDNYEVEHDFSAIGRRIMLLNARQIQRVLGKEKIILLAKLIGFQGIARDITARKKAEELLRASEEKYRTLVENINDILFSLDTQGNITYVSPVVERLSKYKVGDLIGKPLTQFIYTDDLPGVLDSYNRLMNGQLEPLEYRVLDKDGRIIFVRTSSRPLYKDGEVVGITTLMTDITERKKVDEMLRIREMQLSVIHDNVSDVIFVIGVEPDDQFRFVSVNRRFTEVTGVLEDRVVGKPVQEVIPEPAHALVFGKYKEAIRNRQPAHWEEVSVYPAGTKVGEVSVAPVFDANGNCTQLIGTVHDITERKQAEEAVRTSERRFKSIVEHISDIFYVLNTNYEMIYISPQAEKVMGYTLEEVRHNWQSYLTDNPINLAAREKTQLAMATGEKQEPYLQEFMDRHGTKRLIEINESPLKNDKGEVIGMVGAARDVTERKRAETLQAESEAKYRSLVETAGAGIATIDLDGKFTFANARVCRWVGLTEADILGQPFADVIHSDDMPGLMEMFLSAAAGERPGPTFEFRIINNDGQIIWLYTNPTSIIVDGKTVGFNAILIDITERKLADEAILRSKLLLQSVIDSTPDWIYVKDFQHKYLLVNKSFANSQNFAPQDMIGKADTEVFSEEMCLGNPDKGIAGFHADDLQAFQGHLVHNPRNIASWPDGSLHISDTYKIPLTDQSGQIYGALVYSRDMTDQRKAEDERESAIRSLQKTMSSMISTMSRIVEMRDPYTSGHQQRVADLSGAIAREMKLDNSRIEHLVMAAKIHDIGKMYIPSDILDKPGKLSDIELNLIRTHVQGSFDILQDIEFSQPVALMALQHHERLDGSGYPNGLKSGEIMMEAKILAVADVVEAMSFHRPYRPAPGIDKALDEVSRNKGTLYDAAVVDTCLELFSSGKFEFKAV